MTPTAAPRPSGQPMHRALALAIVCLYLALAAGHALTKAPWEDEGFYASPGNDLIVRGKMGVPILEPTGNLVRPGMVYTGANEHIYAMSTLYFLSSAAWYKIAGFSVLSVRAMSILWGGVLLFACCFIVRCLAENSAVALVATACIALNHIVIDAATDGRPDMACAALGYAAIAVYLVLRERRLAWAILLSQALLAAAAGMHPNALYYLIALLVVVACFDLRRLRFPHLLIAGAPYVLLFVPWILYIRSGGATAAAQLKLLSAGQGRYPGVLSALFHEFADRYLDAMYLAPYSHGVARFKVLIVGFYLLGVVGCAASPRIRGHKGYRVLLLITAAIFLPMALVRGAKPYYYLVHIVPAYCALFGIWVYHTSAAGRFARAAAATLAILFAVLNLAWIAHDIRRDAWHHEYAEAVHCVRDRAAPGDFIIAPAGMGFAFGFYDHLIEDGSLGYYTGQRPRWIIADERSYGEAFRGYPHIAPALDRHVTHLLRDDYSLVCRNDEYSVYQKK